MRIVVYGRPGPQGSKAFKGVYRGKDGRGHARLLESSKHVAPWREAVKHAALGVRNGAAALDGPLVARMTFTVAKPKSAPKTRVTYPDTQPDLSKLLRATEDALQDAGAITNDARIVGYSRLWKCYPNEGEDALDAPGCVIVIEPLAAAELAKPVPKQATAQLFEPF